VPIANHSYPAPLECGNELLAIGINFEKHRLRFFSEMTDFACVHELPALQHNDAIARAFDIGHQMR
jgi:hypothetical protein